MSTEPRTVRVWCEQCEGKGEYMYQAETGEPYPVNCTDCGGKGWTHEATLIPLTGGPVVVETRAWEDAVAHVELAMQVERLALSEDVEDGYRERVLLGILAALIPAGIMVASTVGVVGMDNGVSVLFPTDKSEPHYIMARLIALAKG